MRTILYQKIRAYLGLPFVIRSEPGCWHTWGRPVGPGGETTLSDGTPIRLSPVACRHK